jgi:hypothetical protein
LWFLGSVVAGGVEDEFAEQLPGSGVDDADVLVVDEEFDVGSFVGASAADVGVPRIRVALDRPCRAGRAPNRVRLSVRR